MTPEEVGAVLAAAALRDNRHVGAMDVLAWHQDIGDLDAADALAAVSRHYRESRDRLMPVDVRRLVKTIRDERRGHSEALALPSRFEADEERIERVRRGIAQCAEALSIASQARRRTAEAEVVGPLTPSDHIRERALERARRERKGARA